MLVQRSTGRGDRTGPGPFEWTWPSIEDQLPDAVDPYGTGTSTLDLSSVPDESATTAELEAIKAADPEGSEHPFRRTYVTADENGDFTVLATDVTIWPA